MNLLKKFSKYSVFENNYNKFYVYEEKTTHTLQVLDNKDKAILIARTLNRGHGFNGESPKFFTNYVMVGD